MPAGSPKPARAADRGRRRWGWHRLAETVAVELVERSGVARGDLVLDLGAGEGTITRHLVATGAGVVAFELHPERAAILRSRLAGRARVVRADVTDLRLPRRPFRVVANPPFDGLSAVLVRLTAHHSRLERADLVVPVSVARSWTDRLASSAWRVQVTRRVPRSAFTPRPRVDCCVLTIVRR